MAKKKVPINYTGRDFQSIKKDLDPVGGGGNYSPKFFQISWGWGNFPDLGQIGRKNMFPKNVKKRVFTL